MGALYRFLANEYILNHLFGSSVTFPELNPTRYDPFSSSSRAQYNVPLAQRTLASAALTCRAFSAPASYALWKVIDSGLVPLVHTLPNVDKCVREKSLKVRDQDKKPIFYVRNANAPIVRETSELCLGTSWGRFRCRVDTLRAGRQASEVVGPLQGHQAET